MKAAFSVWQDRIAPVFDVALNFLLVEAESGRIFRETEATLTGGAPVDKAVQLAGLDVEVVVCGAISRHAQDMITAYGLRVIPFLAGDLREIVDAWVAGMADIDRFAMPGCCGRRKRNCTPRKAAREECAMRGRKGAGGGTGRGGGSRQAGRMGGPVAAGPGGFCVCPLCGQKEPHEAGIACAQKRCPKCGAVMARE